VRFLPGTDKAFGLQRLCRLRRWNPANLRLIYAGDDENDATAMRWVLSFGGSVFDVGGRTGVPAARVVRDPPALARALRTFARREAETKPVASG
jgi:trehalose-6-phosphatase